MGFKTILSKVKYVNDILDIVGIVFFAMMRLFIAGTVTIVFAAFKIETNWVVKLIIIFYVFYPLYSSIFNKIYYHQYGGE